MLPMQFFIMDVFMLLSLSSPGQFVQKSQHLFCTTKNANIDHFSLKVLVNVPRVTEKFQTQHIQQLEILLFVMCITILYEPQSEVGRKLQFWCAVHDNCVIDQLISIMQQQNS